MEPIQLKHGLIRVCLSVRQEFIGKWHRPNRFGQLFFKIMVPPAHAQRVIEESVGSVVKI